MRSAPRVAPLLFWCCLHPSPCTPHRSKRQSEKSSGGQARSLPPNGIPPEVSLVPAGVPAKRTCDRSPRCARRAPPAPARTRPFAILLAPSRGLFFPAAGFFFPAPQTKVLTQSQSPGRCLERTRIHDPRAALGKLSFAPLWKSGQQVFASKQLEDSISQELQALIVPGEQHVARYFDACRTQLRHCRTVGQRPLEKLPRRKLVAQTFLKRLVCDSDSLLHSSAAHAARFTSARSVAFRQASSHLLPASCRSRPWLRTC